MDGIGIPILGALVSLVLFVLCLAVPRLRYLSLAALASPFSASMVLLLGGFILADMNPAREYGAAYIPSGKEHDPTRLDLLLLFLSVGGAFIVTGYVGFAIQKVAGRILGRFSSPSSGRPD
jgi:hypothetical protein